MARTLRYALALLLLTGCSSDIVESGPEDLTAGSSAPTRGAAAEDSRARDEQGAPAQDEDDATPVGATPDGAAVDDPALPPPPPPPPTLPVTSNLLLRLDPNVGVTKSGATVTAWIDPAKTQAATSGTSTFLPTAFPKQPGVGVKYSGLGVRAQAQSFGNKPFTVIAVATGQPGKLFYVFNSLLDLETADGPVAKGTVTLHAPANGTFKLHSLCYASQYTVLADTGVVHTGAPHVFTMRRTYPKVAVRVDGAMVEAVNPCHQVDSRLVTSSFFGIGMQGAYTVSGDGTGVVGEVLIYDRALSDQELVSVESFLKTKYGL